MNHFIPNIRRVGLALLAISFALCLILPYASASSLTYSTSYATGNGTTSVSVAPGFNTYICEVGANDTEFAPLPSQLSVGWANDTTGQDIARAFVSSIGHQSGNACTASIANSSLGGMAVAGIGVSGFQNYTIYHANKGSSTATLPAIPSGSAFTVIMIADGGGAGGNPITNVSIPSGCTQEVFLNNTEVSQSESAYIAVCGPGSTTDGAVTTAKYDSGTGISMLEYVFDGAPQSSISTSISTSIPTSVTTTIVQTTVAQTSQSSTSVNTTSATTSIIPTTIAQGSANTSSVSSTVPASNQITVLPAGSSAAGTSTGPSALIWIMVVLIVLGVIVFVYTSMRPRSRRS